MIDAAQGRKPLHTRPYLSSQCKKNNYFFLTDPSFTLIGHARNPQPPLP